MPTHDDDFEYPEFTDFTGWEVGRFASTHEAWPAVLAELDRGIPARLLMLDWHWADGTRGRVSSGRLLAFLARSGIGTLDVEEPVRAVG